MRKAIIEDVNHEYLELQTPVSIGKVKNVVNGYISKYDIKDITILTTDRILYSGNYKSFNEMHYDIDEELGTLKQKILDSACIKCLNFNNKALFVFI